MEQIFVGKKWMTSKMQCCWKASYYCYPNVGIYDSISLVQQELRLLLMFLLQSWVVQMQLCCLEKLLPAITLLEVVRYMSWMCKESRTCWRSYRDYFALFWGFTYWNFTESLMFVRIFFRSFSLPNHLTLFLSFLIAEIVAALCC